MSKRKVTIFTGNRAEYGLLRPVIKAACEDESLECSLVVSGAHLWEDFGSSVREIDGANLQSFFEIPVEADESHEQLRVMNVFSTVAAKGAEYLHKNRPDLLLVAGDRYETFAMAVAAFYMNVPIGHMFGGDLSQGGHHDDSARHSITKLAHLHFTASEDSYDRVLGLGEEKWRVYNVGSTAMDNIVSGECTEAEELAAEYGVDFNRPFVLFTQHSVTTEAESAYRQAKQSLEALKLSGITAIITYPNNDPGSEDIIRAIKEYSDVENFIIRKNLGWRNYLGFMKHAEAVVGNSSSGLMETPYFKVPCVNIGNRQQGRLRCENVIDVECCTQEIVVAIKKAVSDEEFRRQVKQCSNPYGDGTAAKKIIEVFKSVAIDKKLLQKKMRY